MSIVLIVGLIVGVLAILVSKKHAEIEAVRRAQDQSLQSTGPPPPPPPPPKPGSPVSCRKDRPTSYACFPEDINPDLVLDGAAGEVNWQCLRHGETDRDGNRVLEPRQCQGINNVDQPYELKESISYETVDYRPGSPLKAFSIDAMSSAADHKGQHTSPQDPTTALMDFFGRVNPHIWQGKPELQQEALDTFAQIKQQCATPQGRSIEGVSATTPSGYEIECSSPSSGIATADVHTYSQQIKIEAK